MPPRVDRLLTPPVPPAPHREAPIADDQADRRARPLSHTACRHPAGSEVTPPAGQS